MNLIAALALAHKGLPIFPLRGKIPLVKFTKEATTDEAQIREWWTEDEHNAGILCDRLLAFDFDIKNGLPGKADLERLIKEDGLPIDAAVHTPSGGYHVITRLPEGVWLRNTVHGKPGSLGAGVDTRSYHGYVVAAGSTGYRWINEPGSYLEIPLAPAGLIARLPTVSFDAKRERTGELGDDSAADIAAAVHWLENQAPEAIEGCGGDNTTFGVAAQVLEYVTAAKAIDLLLDHWNETKAFPPWPVDDIERLVNNALKFMQNKPKGRSANGEFDRYEMTEAPAVIEKEWPQIEPWTPPDPKSHPKRQWVLDGILARGYVTALVAPSGAGKTQWILQTMLGIAAGRNEIANTQVVEQTRVLCWNQEDDKPELERRLLAGMQAFGVGDLSGRIYLNSGVDRALYLMCRDPETRLLRRTVFVKRLIDRIRENDIGVFIIDPLAEFHEANENDNVEMRAVLATLRYIAVQANCAVLIGHHTKKPDKAGSDGFAGNADSARGASSLQGVTRVMLTLYSMSEKDAKRYGVPEDERGAFSRLDGAKSNISEAGRGLRPQWFKWRSVPVGNGDTLGVLETIALAKVSSRVEREVNIAFALVEWLKGQPAGEHKWTDARTALAAEYPVDQLRRWMDARVTSTEKFTDGSLKLTKRAGAQGSLVEWIPLE